ncbi:MAG: 50S ribosomal protein L9 [Candidatus Melainabacteria bacterium]|nr:50S ribosomal protein L9 [Candidatus Melainabacteria bacterium]
MKAILQDNVQKLGKAGEIVEIKRGYFRNFLQPRGLAVLATKGTLKKRDEDLESFRRKIEKAHNEAQQLADKISALPPIALNVKAGDTGKLYGKVTNKEVCQLIEKNLGQEIDKRLVKILGDINSLGTYKVQIKLTPEIQAEVQLEIILEGTTLKDKEKATEEAKTEEGDAKSDESEESEESEEAIEE